MNISYNITPKFNNQYNVNKNKVYNKQQSFTGVSVSKAYDKFCEGVGNHFCRPIFNNKVFDKMGYIMRNSENAVKHFLAVGSFITSGMYMKQTYTNKKMDKDRRMTLTANQGFTWILSTIGAYTLDGSIKSWWAEQHKKFICLSKAGEGVWDGMVERNEAISKQNSRTNLENIEKINKGEVEPDLEIKDEKELGKLVKKFIKGDLKFDKDAKLGIFAQKLADIGITTENPKDTKGLIKKCEEIISSGTAEMKAKLTQAVKTEDYVRKLIEPKIDINDYLDKFGEKHVADKETLKNLKIRSKGFSALRSILVFGFVYRFFVPLTVVKPTNWICEKYLEHKKAKQEQMQANKVA